MAVGRFGVDGREEGATGVGGVGGGVESDRGGEGGGQDYSVEADGVFNGTLFLGRSCPFLERSFVLDDLWR